MLRLQGLFWNQSFSCPQLTGCRSANAGFDLFDDELINEARTNGRTNASDFIIDIREYDVPYHVRVAIDKGTPLFTTSLQDPSTNAAHQISGLESGIMWRQSMVLFP